MKKAMLLIVPVLAIGGVLGAAAAGMINIPGITPKKKAASLYGEANALYGEQGQLAKESEAAKVEEPLLPPKKPKKEKIEEPVVKTDPDLGARKVASLWNGLATDKLKPIAEGYNDEELARVLSFMDAELAAQLLSSMDAKRAVRLSKALERQASIIPDS